MKIEEGKYYKTRDGQVVGPIEYRLEGDGGDEWPYRAPQGFDDGEYWEDFRGDGTWSPDEGVAHAWDLIEEVPAPVADPITSDLAGCTAWPEEETRPATRLDRIEARLAKLEEAMR
jgi:hypothetical protein